MSEQILIHPKTDIKAHQAALLSLLQEFDRVCRALNIPYTLFAGTLLGAIRHRGFIPWDDDLDVLMLREDYERFLREADSVLDHNRFYLQKEFSPHWPMFFSKLRLNNTTCLEKYHPKDKDVHQGVYMDIFPCDNARSSGIGRRIQFLASKVIIAKSLDARGYDTDSRLKKTFILLCRLLPSKLFLRLIRPGKQGKYVHSFFAAASDYHKNVYPRHYFSDFRMSPFEDGSYLISDHSEKLLRQIYGDYMQLPPPEDRVCKEHAILVDLNHSYEYYRNYRDDMTFDVYTRSIR